MPTSDFAPEIPWNALETISPEALDEAVLRLLDRVVADQEIDEEQLVPVGIVLQRRGGERLQRTVANWFSRAKTWRQVSTAEHFFLGNWGPRDRPRPIDGQALAIVMGKCQSGGLEEPGEEGNSSAPGLWLLRDTLAYCNLDAESKARLAKFLATIPDSANSTWVSGGLRQPTLRSPER